MSRNPIPNQQAIDITGSTKDAYRDTLGILKRKENPLLRIQTPTVGCAFGLGV